MDAKCESCGVTCVTRTTSNGKNFGRKYFRCPRCQRFVMWVDQLNQCPCRAGQCKVRTAKTTINNGRQFQCCPRSTGVDNPRCGLFEWLDTSVTEQGGSTTHAIAELGESSQQRGESSQTATLNTASGTSTSPAYLRGYLRGAIRANAQNSKVYEELLEAVEKLELKNPEERTY